MAKFDVNSLPDVKKFNRLRKKAKEYGFTLDIGHYNRYELKTNPRTVARELFGHNRGGCLLYTSDLSTVEGLIEGFGIITRGLQFYANIDYLHVREQMSMKETMDALQKDEY